jgi:hypothetical protein
MIDCVNIQDLARGELYKSYALRSDLDTYVRYNLNFKSHKAFDKGPNGGRFLPKDEIVIFTGKGIVQSYYWYQFLLRDKFVYL